MKNKIVKRLKLLVTIVIISLFVWFLVIYPRIIFSNNEKNLRDAAIRYYELNSDRLPTGERIATLTLEKLFNGSFMKEDLRAPYSGKPCSIDNSWVKVKKVNGQFKYYTYLDCGVMKSDIDHDGPIIELKGKQKMTIGIDEKYDEPGVKSITDNVDGNIDVENITIKGSVDTSKVGNYEITYAAFDSMKNKTVVTREVDVVKRLNSVIKKRLGESNIFVGNPDNNYVLFSNMIFRIVGLDAKGNIIIVSDDNVSYVSYSRMNDWLDYFYDSLTDSSKKLLIKNKYCNMKISEEEKNIKECNSYTNERYAYVPSITDINNSLDSSSASYLKSNFTYLTSNPLDGGKNYVYVPNRISSNSFSYSNSYNVAIKPMLTLNKNTLIIDGDGTYFNPFVFKDYNKANAGDLLNTRDIGEYFSYSGLNWRIVKVEDEYVKAINVSLLNEIEDFNTKEMFDDNSYNPTVHGNYGYILNNNVFDYLDGSIFVTREVRVPFYNKYPVYGKEKEFKNYRVKLSPPDMFELFSATNDDLGSYWFINSSKNPNVAVILDSFGNMLNSEVMDLSRFKMRVVGYIKKDIVVSSGRGTVFSPYIIK